MKKSITIPAAGNWCGSGAKQRVVTPDLAHGVKMVADEAVSCAISVRELAGKFDISRSSAWRLLNNQLSYKAYKPERKRCTIITEAHKKVRVSFCDWLLLKDSGFPQSCLRSDEKLFVLEQRSNKRNEKYWAPGSNGRGLKFKEEKR